MAAAAVLGGLGGGEAAVVAVAATARGRPGRGEEVAAAAAAAAGLCLYRVAPESKALLKATRRNRASLAPTAQTAVVPGPRGWHLRQLRRVGGVPRGGGETVSRAQAQTLRLPTGRAAVVALATAAVAVSRPERVGVVEAVVGLARSRPGWEMAAAAASVAALIRVGTGKVVAATETATTLSRLTPTTIWPSHFHRRAVEF